MKSTASFDIKDVADVAMFKQDANQPLYLPRELELLDQTMYMVERPVLELTTLIPKVTNVPMNQETYTKKLYTGKASASFDAPSSTGHKDAGVIVTVGSTQPHYAYSGYTITDEEILYAQARGVPLESMEAALALAALEELADKTWRVGDAGFGWSGLINMANTQPLLALPNGASGFSTWASKTAEEILKDLILIANYSLRNTREVEKANTILLPKGTFDILDGKFFTNMLSDIGIEQIISNRLAKRGVNVKIKEAFDLEAASPTSTPMIIAYNDQKISRIMSQTPTIKYTAKTVEAIHRVIQMRFGEVVTMNPKSITYVVGA